MILMLHCLYFMVLVQNPHAGYFIASSNSRQMGNHEHIATIDTMESLKS